MTWVVIGVWTAASAYGLALLCIEIYCFAKYGHVSSAHFISWPLGYKTDGGEPIDDKLYNAEPIIDPSRYDITDLRDRSS